MGEILIQAIWTVLAALLCGLSAFFLKNRLGAQKSEKLLHLIKTAVESAQQLLSDASGAQKLSYVCTKLAENGIYIDDTVRMEIESAVYALKQEANKKGQ